MNVKSHQELQAEWYEAWKVFKAVEAEGESHRKEPYYSESNLLWRVRLGEAYKAMNAAGLREFQAQPSRRKDFPNVQVREQ